MKIRHDFDNYDILLLKDVKVSDFNGVKCLTTLNSSTLIRKPDLNLKNLYIDYKNLLKEKKYDVESISTEKTCKAIGDLLALISS